jgi:hypothetical protein
LDIIAELWQRVGHVQQSHCPITLISFRRTPSGSDTPRYTTKGNCWSLSSLMIRLDITVLFVRTTAVLERNGAWMRACITAVYCNAYTPRLSCCWAIHCITFLDVLTLQANVASVVSSPQVHRVECRMSVKACHISGHNWLLCWYAFAMCCVSHGHALTVVVILCESR